MSLRTKQALILFIATVLPFALGAAAVDFVVAPAYRREVGRGSVEMTRRLSEHVAWNLAREITRLEKIAAWESVRRAAEGGGGAAERSRTLNRDWKTLPVDSGPVRELLNRTASRELRWWQQTNPSAAELLATDAHGRVVAASGKPTDLLRRDEGWWQSAYAAGTGRVYVSDVAYDPISRAWGVAVAAPVFETGSPGTRVIGVVKLELDVVRAFEDLGRAELGDSGEALLVDRQGRIVVSPEGGTPLERSAPREILPLSDQARTSRVLEDGDESYLYAWAQVPLAPQMERARTRLPTLYMVTRRSTSEAFAPLRIVQRWMLLISFLTIGAAVTLGYWLADVLVVRPIRTLALGMRELARGEFSRAAAIAEELAGRAPGRR